MSSPVDRDHYQIADLMTRSVAEVVATMPLAEAAERMWSARISSLVVLERGQFIGIVTEHDILNALQSAVARTTPVGEIASRSVVSCSPQTPTANAHAMMQSAGVRHLVVLADGGRVLGLVSDTDFRDYFAADMADPTMLLERLMLREVPTLPTEATFGTALAEIQSSLSDCVVVVDNMRNPVGMLTVRDSVRLFDAGRTTQEAPLAELMSSPVLQVGIDGILDDAVRMMQANRVRHLAVVDDVGKLVGVLIEGVVVKHLELVHHHTIERLKLAASVYNHSHEGIIITDPAGIVIDVNAAFERITGYRYDEVVGRRVGEQTRSGQHGPEFYREMWQTLSAAGLWRGEIVNRRRNGELLVEMLTISAVHRSSGSVSHYVGVFTDITVQRESQDQLTFLNHYDPLTRLPNRTLLVARMRTAIAQAQSLGRHAVVVYLDLDGFGPVNDNVGYETGDRILVEIAGRLTHEVRPGDIVARLASDEFVLLLPDIHRLADAERILEHVLVSITKPLEAAPGQIPPSASIGVSLAPADSAEPDILIRNANHAMRSAKRSGGNCFHLFDADQERRSRTSHEVLGNLRQAMVRGELELHYQPQVNLRSGSVVGAEALLRWNDPQRGLVAPDEFLPHVEDSDFMITLGDWVLETALQQLADWLSAGLRIKLSVNVASQQLRQPDFVDRLRAALVRHPGVPAELLELEIVETAVLEDMDQVSRLIRACQDIGIEFALDDFGTGYASLSHLRDLPARILKIDQGFVRGMLDDPGNLAIIEAVIGLTAAFQRIVVAEGVETEEHGLLLLRLGCDIMQGYAYGRPMPAAEFRRWHADFRAHPEWARVCAEHIPREEFPLLAAEIDHRRWVECFVRLAEGEALLMSEIEVDDEHRCAFGRWFFGAGQEHFGQLPMFQAIAEVHHRVHRVGSELLDLHREARHDDYRQHLAALEALHGELIGMLRELRTSVAHTALQPTAFAGQVSPVNTGVS